MDALTTDNDVTYEPPALAAVYRWLLSGLLTSCVAWTPGCSLAPYYHADRPELLSPQLSAHIHSQPIAENSFQHAHHDLPVAAAPALLFTPRVPANYTGQLKPDLAAVELARWWEAFQSPPLQQLLSSATSQRTQYSTSISLFSDLPPNCGVWLLSMQNGSQIKQHLELHVRQQLLADITHAYFDASLVKEKLNLATEHLLLAEQLAATVKRRYDDGDVGRADVLISEAAKAKQLALINELTADWNTSINRLRSLAGFAVPIDQLEVPTVLSFPQPLLIDLGSPGMLLSRHHDLQALQEAIALSQNGSQSIAPDGTALIDCYQDRIDFYYSKVEAASSRLEPLLNENYELNRSVRSLSESYELVLEQYALGRASVLDVLKIDRLLQEVKDRRAANYHQFLTAHVEMYASAGGGDSTIGSKPNQVGSFKVLTEQHDPFPSFAPHNPAEYSLLAPTEAQNNASQIVLLPPLERVDELGKGTVTVVSLGRPVADSPAPLKNKQRRQPPISSPRSLRDFDSSQRNIGDHSQN